METSDLPLSILQPFQSLSVSSTTIDFDRDFAGNKTREELAAAINHALQLHTGSNLEKFHLYFCPQEKFLPDIENWVAFAVRKGVKEINLDFSMGFDDSNEESWEDIKSFNLPACLFRCETLTRLSLSHCNFLPPTGFVGFQNLHSLSLSYVNVTGDLLQQFIAGCPLLDSLRIACCTSLDSIKVSSQKLRKLIVENGNYQNYDLEISAPKLESFVYYGPLGFADPYFSVEDSFIDVSSLSGAFFHGVGSEDDDKLPDFIKAVYRQVTVLTVCSDALWSITCMYDDDNLPSLLGNLKELQLLVGFMSWYLEVIYRFFKLCPSPLIEKLFIQLSGYNGDLEERMLRLQCEEEDPLGANFNHLKVIMVRNFLGCEGGMRLVSFLLQKAANLESLVIIAHPKYSEQSMDMEQSSSELEIAPLRINDLMSLHAQLSLLPKASPLASIVLCKHSEFEMYWTPTHTEYFGEY